MRFPPQTADASKVLLTYVLYCRPSLTKSASACNGNVNETCGGPNGLNVFQLTGWYPVGCWNDTVGMRALNHEQYGIVNMTNEKCTAACKTAGYTFAGTEYASEYVLITGRSILEHAC